MSEFKKKEWSYHDFLKFFMKECYLDIIFYPELRVEFRKMLKEYLSERGILQKGKLEKLKEILLTEINDPLWKIVPIKSFIPTGLILILLTVFVTDA